VPGTTVLVERDPSGDEDDRPLKLKLVKPKKRPAKKREPVGVGAKSGEGEGPSPDGAREDGGGTAPEDSADEPTDGAGADAATDTE
jgi:hypothetical protein